MPGLKVCLRYALVLTILGGASAPPEAPGARPSIADRVPKLTRQTRWTLAATIKLPFRTFHPQGMVRIDDTFYLSSVEITRRSRKLAPSVAGHDRDAGAGFGHLFKIDRTGKLLADLTLGEGAIYHPGGIDDDGMSIWVPVAEYRPDSHTIIYRVDPATMKASEAGRVDDHIGGLVHAADSGMLYGISWGSRRLYSWRLTADDTRIATPGTSIPNPAHYIDYQDCHHTGARHMTCGGLAEYRNGPDAPTFKLGGLELVDLHDGRPDWQMPIELRSPSGRPMTQNAMFLEATQTGLRAYFAPDDDETTIYVYDAPIP